MMGTSNQKTWRWVALLATTALTSVASAANWVQCATENGYCTVPGTRVVRYGIDTRWTSKTVTNGIACTNTAFGTDPAYGTGKVCQYDATNLPDLVVSSISPTTASVGQAIYFKVVVTNRGTASTPSNTTIGVRFSVDGVAGAWAATATPLAAGASVTLTANGGPNGVSSWTATSGTHTIQAFVDDVNRMPELDENNNKLSSTLTVGSISTTTTLPPTTTTTTTVPTVTTTTLPSSTSGTDLTINQAISDMSLSSEALPIAAYTGWMYKPVITQPSPAGSSIASWWTGERPTWCYGLLSWYTLYEAEGNKATNTRVEVKNLRVYILSNSTRTWSQWNLVAAPNTGLWNYPFTGGSTAPDRRLEPDGGVSFQPVYPNFRHGYGNTNYPAKALPNPSDVRALFIAIDMKLVVADPSRPDDRAVAKYVVDSGADYYPDGTYKMWSAGYAPGAGNGRYLLATPNWRSATLVVPNTLVGATYNEILNNPPPMK